MDRATLAAALGLDPAGFASGALEAISDNINRVDAMDNALIMRRPEPTMHPCPPPYDDYKRNLEAKELARRLTTQGVSFAMAVGRLRTAYPRLTMEDARAIVRSVIDDTPTQPNPKLPE